MKEANRKKYEKPAMRVFRLREKPRLLAGSGDGIPGSRSPYGDPTNYNWN